MASRAGWASVRTRGRLPGYNTGVEARAVVGMIGGRYRLNGMLGEGGMARVFDAFDDRLQRAVAVKILRPQTEALPGMRTRFQREARMAASLVHPNIVAVLDYGEDGAASYLVMERLPGRTLRDEIARGPIAPERLIPLMTETLGALAAAHKYGVLHRDIKPSNILLDDEGHAKITDFGIAKSFDVRAASAPTADLTMTGVVLGTPGYLAPERRLGHPATVQSDVYSVGAVMVEALTGRRPPSGAEGELPLPAGLSPVARRALATDPRQRFTSADEMLAALRLGPRSTTSAAGVGRRHQAPRRRHVTFARGARGDVHPSFATGAAAWRRPPPVVPLPPPWCRRRHRRRVGPVVPLRARTARSCTRVGDLPHHRRPSPCRDDRP